MSGFSDDDVNVKPPDTSQLDHHEEDKQARAAEAVHHPGKYLVSPTATRGASSRNRSPGGVWEEAVRAVLDVGDDVALTSYDVQAAFHRACATGNLPCVRVLLREGVADPDGRDVKGQTAMHWAAHYGHRDVLRLLLKHGCSPNAPDRNHQTPLFECVQQGHLQSAKVLLLEGGARTDVKNHLGNTALIISAILGKCEILGLLLQFGTDVNARGFKGLTALHCAALHGHAQCVKLLLDARADPDVKAFDSATPAHLTVRNGKPPQVQISVLRHLHEVNADLEARMKVKFGLKRRYLTTFGLSLVLGDLGTARWLAAETGCHIGLLFDWLAHVPSMTTGGTGDSCTDEDIAWLCRYATNPRQLTLLCRTLIRWQLGREDFSPRLAMLPLPEAIKDFIYFMDVLS